MTRNSGRFQFDGGAATYVGTAILGFLVTLCTWEWQHADFDPSWVPSAVAVG